MLGNQDKVFDELTDFGVRVTDRRFTGGFEASNRGQSSCRCTLDQWLDLIGVVTS